MSSGIFWRDGAFTSACSETAGGRGDPRGLRTFAADRDVTIDVNGLNIWPAFIESLPRCSSFASHRVESGDLVIEATASVQIAVLEELRAPDLNHCRNETHFHSYIFSSRVSAMVEKDQASIARSCHSTEFDEAVARFAVEYADQNARDHEALLKTMRAGRIAVLQE